jgi:nicotinamidase-related amidase
MTAWRPVLLVHDVVNHFIDPSDPAQTPMLENVRTLVAKAREVNLPIVFICPQGDGPSVDPPAYLAPMPGDTVIRKPRWGGFYGTNLTEHLQATGHDALIICGFSLGGGVLITALDAFNRDFHAIVPADACLCRSVPDQGWGAIPSELAAKVLMSVINHRFARVTSTAATCRALASFAGDLDVGLLDDFVVEK